MMTATDQDFRRAASLAWLRSVNEAKTSKSFQGVAVCEVKHDKKLLRVEVASIRHSLATIDRVLRLPSPFHVITAWQFVLRVDLNEAQRLSIFGDEETAFAVLAKVHECSDVLFKSYERMPAPFADSRRRFAFETWRKGHPLGEWCVRKDRWFNWHLALQDTTA